MHCAKTQNHQSEGGQEATQKKEKKRSQQDSDSTAALQPVQYTLNSVPVFVRVLYRFRDVKTGTKSKQVQNWYNTVTAPAGMYWFFVV
jgi:hypothetical protein